MSFFVEIIVLYWILCYTIIAPKGALEEGNIIPQCEKCNRADRNYWIYNEKGRVVKIANPKVIDNCSIKIQKEIYARLYKKFNGEKPSEN